MEKKKHPCRLRLTDLIPGYGLCAYPLRVGKAKAESFVNDVVTENYHEVEGIPFGDNEESPELRDHSFFLSAYNYAVIVGSLVAYAYHTGFFERI